MMKKIFSILTLSAYSLLLVCAANFGNIAPCHADSNMEMAAENLFSSEKKCEACVEKSVTDFNANRVKKSIVEFSLLPVFHWPSLIDLPSLTIVEDKKYIASFEIPIKIRQQQKNILRI